MKGTQALGIPDHHHKDARCVPTTGGTLLVMFPVGGVSSDWLAARLIADATVSCVTVCRWNSSAIYG
jgi:hypothetical protein